MGLLGAPGEHARDVAIQPNTNVVSLRCLSHSLSRLPKVRNVMCKPSWTLKQLPWRCAVKAKIQVGRNLLPAADRVIEIMKGPSAKGPKRCLLCQESFKCGELWLRYTSARDPRYGSYSIGVHEKCRDVKLQKPY